MPWNAEDRTRERPGGASYAPGSGLAGLVLQVLRLPMTLLAFAAELAAWTAREMERVTGEGEDWVLGRAARSAEPPTERNTGPGAGPGHRTEPPGSAPPPGAPETANPGAARAVADPRREERRAMPDTNLADDMVKLVRYSIVSIQRDAEKILHRDEVIFDDNMSDDGFATWVISKYGEARGLSSDDRKYLRVSYEVLDRWARQDRKYEKRQLEVLEGIRDALEE